MREASSSPLAISPVSASSSRKRQQQSVHSTNNSNAASTPNKHLRVQDKVVAETMEEFLSNPEHYYPCRGWVWDTFGPDSDTAMLHCIRKSAHRAVRKLLVCGDRTVLLQMENAKGITPLILAAQNGQLETVKLFLQFGADACHVASSSGKTAVLQAAHFGRLQVLQYLLENTSASSLMELENSNATTPLMRASQEGHLPVVKYLVQKGASVNRKNRERMTALMLASQRGHEKIVHYLIDHGYAELDSMTSGNATAVTLATKRNHFRTVQALVSAGCELLLPNSRGQTPQQIALEKHKNTQLADLLEPSMQVHLMRSRARQQQSWALVRMWILIQRQRAYGRHSTHIFLRIMNLPAPLLQLIVEFTPLPDLWDKRIGLLTKRCAVNATAGLESALDLLDEVLEEGGFLHACDELGSMIPPPKPFATWVSTHREKILWS